MLTSPATSSATIVVARTRDLWMKGLAARKQGHAVTDSGSPPGIEPGHDGKSRPQSKRTDHSVCLERATGTSTMMYCSFSGAAIPQLGARRRKGPPPLFLAILPPTPGGSQGFCVKSGVINIEHCRCSPILDSHPSSLLTLILI